MQSDLSGRRNVHSPLGHVFLDGTSLNRQQVMAVARDGATVKVSAKGRKRAEAAYRVVLRAAKKRPVYGQSTGVGSNKDVRVNHGDAAQHGLNLIRSHAAGAGPLLSSDIARAMMVVRLNQLMVGGSGASPAFIDGLEYALNNGLTPPISRFGAIGTSDMTALGTTALCMLGERPWQGGTMPACEIGTTDALAFMSSSAATLGEATLGCSDLHQLLRAGLRTAALSFVALGGNVEALSEQVQAAHPHLGQKAVAAELRGLLKSGHRRNARFIQDTFCLRTLPQVQGAALDALNQAEAILSIEMNATTENPLVDILTGDVFHNGNFHAIYVSLSLDGLRAAVYNVAELSAARVSALMEPSLTALRPFLASGPEASSGLLITEYIAQSALAELRHLAAPDSLGSAVISRGAEEHASFATQSAWHTAASVAAYETVLACEFVAATRALRQQDVVPKSGPLKAIFDKAATTLEPSSFDRSIEVDIARATESLRRL